MGPTSFIGQMGDNEVGKSWSGLGWGGVGRGGEKPLIGKWECRGPQAASNTEVAPTKDSSTLGERTAPQSRTLNRSPSRLTQRSSTRVTKSTRVDRNRIELKSSGSSGQINRECEDKKATDDI